MTVASRTAFTRNPEVASGLACPQGPVGAVGLRPDGNPGHFGGIAILPLFLDEPESSLRRQRLRARTHRAG